MGIFKLELFFTLKDPNETPAPTRAETREERITRKVTNRCLQSSNLVHVLIKAHSNIYQRFLYHSVKSVKIDIGRLWIRTLAIVRHAL